MGLTYSGEMNEGGDRTLTVTSRKGLCPEAHPTPTRIPTLALRICGRPLTPTPTIPSTQGSKKSGGCSLHLFLCPPTPALFRRR